MNNNPQELQSTPEIAITGDNTINDNQTKSKAKLIKFEDLIALNYRTPKTKVRGLKETSDKKINKILINKRSILNIEEEIGTKDAYLVDNKLVNTTGNNSIQSVLNEVHPDVKIYINENNIRSYLATADGLIIKFDNHIRIMITYLNKGLKKYRILGRKNEIIHEVIN